MQRATRPAPALRERKQQLVREAIWDAAIQLFSGKGFDETTIEDIAEAAGVSRRTFFRYFSSKNDLMVQGVVNFGASLAELIAGAPAPHSPARVLRELVREAARHSTATPRARAIMQIAARYPAAREAQASRIAELQDRVEQAWRKRCRKSGGDTAHPAVLASLTLGILGVTFQLWFAENLDEADAAADRVLTLFQRTLAEAVKTKG